MVSTQRRFICRARPNDPHRIIVGVKYCFRYNQRARQGLIDAETGEPIDLANLPRPRRRREKKLMSMEEVNERFPLTKYKIWRASREGKGLSTAGGVAVSASRPSSIKEVEPIEHVHGAPEVIAPATHINVITGTTKHVATADVHDTVTAPARQSLTIDRSAVHSADATAPGASEKGAHAAVRNSQDEQNAEDEDADPILTAMLPDYDAQPGDACAICIDNLDDDDEVRGLTCGHAFHAACLDPWLTGRRACCPLCKADYFVPKPRLEGESDFDGRRDRTVGLSVPQSVWMGGRGALSFRPSSYAHDRFGFPVADGRIARHGVSAAPPDHTRGLRVPFLGRFSRRNGENAAAPAASTIITPAQLEAGR